MLSIYGTACRPREAKPEGSQACTRRNPDGGSKSGQLRWCSPAAGGLDISEPRDGLPWRQGGGRARLPAASR
jgi:hypothetical protein